MKKNRTVPARALWAALAAAVVALPCAAQETQAEVAGESAAQQAPVVVTATRIEQSSFDLPTAITSIDQQQIQDEGKLGVQISEQLNQVPGTVVQNRDSFAQEQQITIRGFGARSQFGTRGVKLLADGIPVSTPDGQGNPGLFDLDSAGRIEVLRGPFSALYGNHSAGVVQVFTQDGPADPTLTFSGMAGSWDTWKAGVKFGGTTPGRTNYIGSASTFSTDGYRDHSAARKDQFNSKLSWELQGGSTLGLVINYLNQPDNEDPLGLTATQVQQNRRQADPLAEQFNTGRSLDNTQAGLVFETPLTSNDTLRLMGYLGSRNNNGLLAIPVLTQNQVKQSGGVTNLSRNFGGFSGRWTHTGDLFGGAYTLSTGGEFDFSNEDRHGYINNNGTQGALKRDENDTADSWGVYMQGEWQATEKLSTSAGVRWTKVQIRSDDFFICTNTVNTTGTPLGTCSGTTNAVTANSATWNPDDSGHVTYSAVTPVGGLVYKLTPAVNLYANAGRSFETPTFIEVAYRLNGSGLNFDLNPAESTHYEIGAKAFLTSQTRMEVALFHVDTSDEIVVQSNAGGRATYQNADTRRTGVELALNSNLGYGFAGLVSYTALNAYFSQDFSTCPQPAPTGGPPCPQNALVSVPSGNNIPGVPNQWAYGELSWAYAPYSFTTAVEVRWQDKVYVNDVNTQYADAFTVVNLRFGLEQRAGKWAFGESFRVDNLFDQEYIGGVIVNDSNGRYYAPAPTTSYTIGATVAYKF